MNDAQDTAGTERVISRLLAAGVTASLVLVSLGMGLWLVAMGGDSLRPGSLAALVGEEGSFPRSPSWVAAQAARLDGKAVVVLGLLLLIATPVLRVAVSVQEYARRRDGIFVLVTLAVLSLLVLSFALGAAG